MTWQIGSAASLGGEILDSCYARLRSGREHGGGRAYTEHRTERPHE